jgi:predicted nucleotidyltransferase component of viral defense system
VAQEKSLALKGGTAINLFIRNMPRLSVDIDLTYLPVKDRPQSLAEIDAAMKRIARRIRDGIPRSKVIEARAEGATTKLFVQVDGARVKIEVTPVLRGCVAPPVLRSVSRLVEDTFGFAEIDVVSFADLYGGKLVAALDRQHPRDLFDVGDLLAAEGIDDTLRQAFIVYLLSHHRPMFEVLAVKRKNLAPEYARGFQGMTEKPVSRTALEATREKLVDDIVNRMPDSHRAFLVSFERGKPQWDLLGVPDAADLPAVKWRQRNLDTLAVKARSALVQDLERVLDAAKRS